MSEFNLGPADATASVNAAPDSSGMVFDLNNTEEVSFEVVPKGTYPAIVEELEYTTSQSSGNPMLKIVFALVGGEFDERKIFEYLVLAGEGAKYALPKLKQFLVRVCPEVDISAFNPEHFAEAGIALGRECQVKLTISTQKSGDYKGEKRNNVREVLAAEAEGSFLG